MLEGLTKKPIMTPYQRDLSRCLNSLGALYANTSRATRAEEVYRQAAEILERLDRDHAGALDLAEELGTTYVNLAAQLAKRNKFPEALDYFGKGLARLDPLYDKVKGREDLRTMLRVTHKTRALLLAQLGRQAESVPDWDRILELDRGTTPKEDRFGRLSALARKGDHARVVAEAEALAAGAAGGDLYDLACVYSLASAAVRKDRGLSSEEQKERAEQYAARAVELLKQAHAEGFLQGPLNWQNMVGDADLEAIRKHPAYKEFVEKARPRGDK